ncbi:hypothetical protein C6988_06890 [Nitrosopumilus sp. b1]|nr:hypothetical protein C6988_06890 [Nitrosopumilus sp. b1]
MITQVIMKNLLANSMTSIKTKAMTLSVAAIFSVTMIAGFQLNEIVAEKGEDKGYTFAEETQLLAVFTYKNGIEEQVPFEAINQIQSFDNTKPPIFKLEKIVSDNSPYLYKHADEFHNLVGQSNTRSEESNKMDIDVLFIKHDDVVRSFSYQTCKITDYKIETLYDKEEGWNSDKGFAHLEQFEFSCYDYSPVNPVYEIITNGHPVAKTKSSVEYQKEQTLREQLYNQ